jgi:hypothetical protein
MKINGKQINQKTHEHSTTQTLHGYHWCLQHIIAYIERDDSTTESVE